MSEGTTCYERDEALCEDQMCLRVGCKIRNLRLSSSSAGSEQALLPCPCCDSPSVHACEDDVWHLVRCTNLKCGMQSGIFPTKPWAFRVWNARLDVGAQAVPDHTVENLAMMLRRMIWLAGKTANAPLKKVSEQAMGLLVKYGQQGSPLREEAAQPTQGGDKGEAVAWRTRWKTGGERDREWEMWTYRPDRPAPDENKIIEPLYAAPQPASNAYTPQDYSAWLIEMPERFGPLYFHFEHDDDWTKDHDKACHFARKEDAEKVIEHYGWTRAVAAEHMWPASSLSAEMKTAVASARASAAARRVTPITRRSEADSYFQILQAIARFPITDPKNMDAVNMRLIAEGALAIPSTEGK